MPPTVVEPRSFPMLSRAYGDLADGLRGLAADLETLRDPAAETEPATPSVVREVVETTVRGMGAVFLQALVLGAVLLAGFQVWMVLFPPSRPTT